MRLIDADALRESIITRQTEMSYEDAWALTCVDNAPTIEPQKWIPVSERLPDVGQKVLASTNKTCFTQVFKGTSGASNSSWWWEKRPLNISLHGVRYLSHGRGRRMTISEKIDSLKEQIAEISNEYCDGYQEYCCDQCTEEWKGEEE